MIKSEETLNGRIWNTEDVKRIQTKFGSENFKEKGKLGHIGIK
jgi:hypothetical protein